MDAALATGATFWNGGQFYGTPEYNSLHLLRDYFTEHPDAAKDVVLSIKGGLTLEKIPDGSEKFVRQSVEECLRILPRSLKKVDIFQCARVDPNTPIESTMKTLRKLVEEGKIGAVGLSEVKAETIQRANAVVPIAAVEVEFSLFETSILKNGVASTCAKFNIPVVAYSPLGRGLLTGKITKAADLPANSPLRRLDKYQGENLDHNLRLVKALQELSEKHRDYFMPAFALSWIRQLSGRDGLGAFIPICGSSRAENVRTNAQNVHLTDEDFKSIQKVLDENETVGERAYPGQRKYLEG
ncbi:Pyridoxine 4-dehydrogenase [Hypocenomyce scalaris]|nr:Pyridoxine 4-dehydrogenase [Hypocenomyce scalaris]